MKLTKNKLLETLRRKNDGWTTYQARKIARISIRRVNQVWTEYLETGTIPEIGKRNGRPAKPITDEEVKIVKEAYETYRVSASTLRKIIDRDYELRINHNRIHKVLINLGYAKPLNKQHKREEIKRVSNHKKDKQRLKKHQRRKHHSNAPVHSPNIKDAKAECTPRITRYPK